MTTSIKHFSKWTALGVMGLIGLFGTVADARAAVMEGPGAKNCRQLPVIKNLTGLRAQRVCDTRITKELTPREVKKLTANANSSEDHLTLARYYRAKADNFDARAAGYEEAAAELRNGPAVKNFVSPTTAARYAFVAKGFREEAKSNRALATSHEQMAKNVVAKL
jgi:hypothetical protein